MNIYKFFMPTCGPCKALENNLKEAGFTKYESVDITTDEGMKLAEKYEVLSVPKLVIDTGEKQLHYKGVKSVKELQEIKDMLNNIETSDNGDKV